MLHYSFTMTGIGILTKSKMMKKAQKIEKVKENRM